MIITIERELLVQPLRNLIGISEQRQTMPILGHVLIEVSDGFCKIIATDLEIQVTYSMKLTIPENFKITVPSRKFYDILKSLDSETITLEIGDSDITIKSGKSKFKVAMLDPKDFPTTEVTAELKTQLNAQTTLNLINRTSFSMGYQDARHFLNGLYVEMSDNQITAVATDGHRLAYSTETINYSGEPTSSIIPRKCITEIKKILSTFDELSEILIDFSVSSKNLELKFNNYVLTTKLIEGNYPDYRNVFPKSVPNELLVNKNSLKTSLQRLSILSTEQYKGVKFKIDSSSFNLSTTNPLQESGDESLDCSYSGEAVQVGFNLSYLIETIDVIDTEDLSINLGSPDSGCLVTPKGDQSAKYIIMPMRV